jgi:hypothetical protein
VKAQVNKENNIQDVNSYGLNVEDELTKILSDEISKSIDLEIMKQLVGTKSDKIKRILEKIKQIK